MYQAFNKVDQVPPSEDSKKGFIWVLANSALVEGVKSTTRYRKQNLHKRSCKTEHPAPQRQISGAKGGKAAKKSAMLAGKMPGPKTKRSSRAGRTLSSYAKDTTTDPSRFSAFEEYRQHLRELEQDNKERMGTLRSAYLPDATHSYLHTPSATPISSIPEPRMFQLSDVVGCADLGLAPLFYDDPIDAKEDGISSHQMLGSSADAYIDYNFSEITT